MGSGRPIIDLQCHKPWSYKPMAFAVGPPQQITDFESEQIWYFDCTRDGKQFVLARGSLTSDVVLISSSE
jgi:hypothetical protein